MKQEPGFHGNSVFESRDGGGRSITLFGRGPRAHEKALARVRGSLTDLIDGDQQVTSGEVLASVAPDRWVIDAGATKAAFPASDSVATFVSSFDLLTVQCRSRAGIAFINPT